MFKPSPVSVVSSVPIPNCSSKNSASIFPGIRLISSNKFSISKFEKPTTSSFVDEFIVPAAELTEISS